jgi:hypothetical protein
MEVIALVLRQHQDVSQSRINTVRKREVQDLVRPTKSDCWFWFDLCQGSKPFTHAARENKHRDPTH